MITTNLTNMEKKLPKTNSGLDIYFNEANCKPEEASGIVATITISCETEDELLTHLSVIRSEVKKILKHENEVKRHVFFDEENCYGSHNVDIDLFK